VAAVALLALSSNPASLGTPAKAFAAEATPVVWEFPNNPYCSRYCFGQPGAQWCSTSPGERNGCHHISSTHNCIFTLCAPDVPPDPEVIE
jgi:hypothetical protein